MQRLATVLGFLFLIGVSLSAPPPGVPVVRIGRTISRTGFYSTEAKPVINGVHFWYEWLNKTTGLLFTNNNTQYYLELVEYDDASSETNVDVLYRALDAFDGVAAAFGPWSTALTTPAMLRTNKSGLPFIFTAGAPQFYTSGYAHSVGMFVTAFKRLSPCMDEFALRKNATSAVIIASTDPFQQSVLPLHANKLRSLNVTVIWNKTVALDETEFAGLVTDVIAANPDIIVCLMETATYGPFLQELRKKTEEIPRMVYNINAGTVASAYTTYGWELDGAFGATQWSPFLLYNDSIFGSPRAFADEYAARFNYTPDFVDALAVMSGFVMLDALERAESFSHADIISALRSTNLPESILGPVTFLASGEISSSALCVQLLPPNGTTLPDKSTERSLLPVAPALQAVAESVVPFDLVRPPGPKYTRAQKIGIIVGCTLAGVLVLGALIVVAVYLFNRKYHVLFFERGNVPKDANEW